MHHAVAAAACAALMLAACTRPAVVAAPSTTTTAVSSTTTTATTAPPTTEAPPNTAPPSVDAACQELRGLLDPLVDEANRKTAAAGTENLAHPYGVSDVWGAAEQQQLESIIARLNRDVLPDSYQGFLTSLLGVAQTLDPNGFASRVDRETAVATATQACVGD